jgi:hypothetical protein
VRQTKRNYSDALHEFYLRRISGVFANLPKTAVSCVMSVRLEQLGSHFLQMVMVALLLKSVEKTEI